MFAPSLREASTRSRKHKRQQSSKDGTQQERSQESQETLLTYDVDEQDRKREEFARCSGMHTHSVLSIVKEVSVAQRFRNPLTAIGFVIPAFVKGIPQHLDSINLMAAEIAIYGALFVTIFSSAFFGGFAPPPSKYDDLRTLFLLGYYIGIFGCGISIATSVWFRLASASLARESDMLVFIYKTSSWLWVNAALWFVNVGCVFMCMQSARQSALRGDHCLDGSMAFMAWWYEWVFDDYPHGQGVDYAKDIRIKNPWALKADELGLLSPMRSEACTSSAKVSLFFV